jgi:hypothetical protein
VPRPLAGPDKAEWKRSRPSYRDIDKLHADALGTLRGKGMIANEAEVMRRTTPTVRCDCGH